MTHLDIVKKVWSDWTVSEKLGEGSFGQVFRAKKERFGIIQEAAIKVVYSYNYLCTNSIK